MKKKLLACFLAVMLVTALVIAVTPSAKAEDGDLIYLDAKGAVTIDAGNQDKILDLQGNKNAIVTFNVETQLKVIDTSFKLENGNLDVSGTNAGVLTINPEGAAGTIAPVTLYGDYRYLAVEKNGAYSFHPFNMSITRTGINVKSHTVSLEAVFIANKVVRDMITDFGVYKVNGATTGYMSAKSNYDFAKDAYGTVACYDLTNSLQESMLEEERTFCAYIKIEGVEEPILGNQRVDVTPATVLGNVNAEYAAGKYTGATKALADQLYAENEYLHTYLPALGAPVVGAVQNEVVKVYDLYALDNKADLVIDFAENVVNEGGLALTYSVQHNGEEVALDGTCHTFAFGTYTDAATYEVFNVTVSYTVNGAEQSITYTYKLALRDSTLYRLANGGFENGLAGWNKVGNIGDVSADTHYWLNDPECAEGFAFGMDGSGMFSAYAPGAKEAAVGTLTSSTFKVGGSGFVTFMIGAMRDGNYVYVDVVDAESKEILARYYNGLWAERTNDVKSGCTLVAYKADLSAFVGKEVFFRISDNADSGYGLFFADSFNTYYETEPEGFNYATPVNYTVSGTIYDLFNGGFEMGNVQGWWNNGEIGVVTDANCYWNADSFYNKHGNYLFTGVESFGVVESTMREGNRGVLTSSTFEIGGTGYISFMLGGGGNALCYVQVIDSTTGEILARYRQQAQQDAKLIQYVADLNAYIGRTARIQVVDQAENGWGCVSFDNVVTYYASIDSLPEGTAAIDIKGNIKYTIDNGGFESGNIDGWTMNITEAGAHNTLGWVLETEDTQDWYTKNEETKEGTFLFTFLKPEDVNCENTKGTLQSSTFSLKQGAFVSFKFGGAGAVKNHDVYIELCRADGSVIAKFFNDAPNKVNTKMNAYYYQYQGVEVECFFRVVDNSTGDYGCFVVDDFRVNLESAPEGFIAAIQ